MKTINIPNSLHKQLKVRAAAQGMKLNELVAELLEDNLNEGHQNIIGADTLPTPIIFDPEA
ncbi:MAG: toxin-antitoxin system HicB family antitoxin [Arenibacterium sp.]